MPDRLPGKQPDLDRIELVLEDAREHAHRIIDESVEQAQELLVRRSGHDPFFDALIGSLTGLSEDVRDLRRRLERIEALLRSPAAAPPAERAPAAEPATAAAPPPPSAAAPPRPPRGDGPPAVPRTPTLPADGLDAARAPAPHPAQANAPGGARFAPDAGSVTLHVAPVSGFQGLMRVQDALGQIQAVHEATVQAYSQGEARLRLHLREPITTDEITGGLTRALQRSAHLETTSVEDRTIQVALA